MEGSIFSRFTLTLFLILFSSCIQKQKSPIEKDEKTILKSTFSSEAPEAPTLNPASPQSFSLGDVIARVETQVPSFSPFVLKANIPLPKNYYPGDGKRGFAIRTPSRQIILAQVDSVSLYPDGESSDIIEIIAKVPTEGTNFTKFDVLEVNFASVEQHQDWKSNPLVLAPQIIELLSAQPVKISAADKFGHRYAAYPMSLQVPSLKIQKMGAYCWNFSTYSIMQPEKVVGGAEGTLPHLFGIHAFFEVCENDPYFKMDIRVSNGWDNFDKVSHLDDHLGRVYFDQLDIRVPRDYSVQQAFAGPTFDATGFISGANKIQHLISPLPSPKLHVMDRGTDIVRRLIISKGNEGKARQVLDRKGHALVMKGDESENLFSWYNYLTARYYPNKHLLPTFEHLGLQSLRSELNNRFDEALSYLENGTDQPGDTNIGPTSGPYKHYGAKNGKATSGQDISFFRGVRTAFARNSKGLRYFELYHRMVNDRQHDAFYDVNGEYTYLEKWNGYGDLPNGYYPIKWFNSPILGHSDPDPYDLKPFKNGTFSYPQSQVNADQKPDYEDYFYEGVTKHDWQHFGRYTWPAKVLAYLMNDQIAINSLVDHATRFKLHYHMYPYGTYNGGEYYGDGMKAELDFVTEHPHTGTNFHRGEGWGTSLFATGFALGDEEFRQRNRAWFSDLLNVVELAQIMCSGFIQGYKNHKVLNGEYRAMQTYEEIIVRNGLRSVMYNVFDEEFSSNEKERLSNILLRGYYGMISDYAWFEGSPQVNKKGPFTAIATGPLNSDVLFCTEEDLSANPGSTNPPQHQNGIELWHTGIDLAAAYELSNGDDVFIQKAVENLGNGSCQALKNQMFQSEAYDKDANLVTLLQYFDCE